VALLTVTAVAVAAYTFYDQTNGYSSDTTANDVRATGTMGEGGAPWRLYTNGTVVVDSGYANLAVQFHGPWYAYSPYIYNIVFSGPLIAGQSLMGLFRGLTHLTDITGLEYLNTSNVRHMSGMFAGTNQLTNLDVSSLDTSNVTSLSAMFSNSGVSALDLSSWDTSNVMAMNAMFRSTTNLESLDLSNWNTSNVVYMGFMFEDTQRLASLDLNGWDTSNVLDMSNMFAGTSSLTNLDISSWDTKSATHMNHMFAGSNLTTLDLSNWDTTNVTDMLMMFERSSISILDLSGWDTRNVEDMILIFHDAPVRQLALGENFSFSTWVCPYFPEEYRGSEFTHYFGLYEIPRNETYTGLWQNVGTGSPDAPQGTQLLTTYELLRTYNGKGTAVADTWVWQQQEWDRTGIGATGTVGAGGAQWRLDMGGTVVVDSGPIGLLPEGHSPWYAYRYRVRNIIFSGPMTPGSSLAGLFRRLQYLTDISGLEYFDTSNVVDMSHMFQQVALESLDLTSWDTRNVVNMGVMFNATSSLMYLNLSGWDTSNVTNMRSMFNSTRLEHIIGISGWDTSSVTTMNSMFRASRMENIACISRWDTSNVTDMDNMFSGSQRLTAIDILQWDTSSVTSMYGMFMNTRISNLDLSSWDTRNVTNMNRIFSSHSLTSLDISSWDTSNASMIGMFFNSRNLNRLTLGNHFVFTAAYNHPSANTRDIVISIESGLQTTLENAQLPAFSSLLQPISKRNTYITPFDGYDIPSPFLTLPYYPVTGIRLPRILENETYTGRWQNIGPGTVYAAQGTRALTSDQLVETFNGATMADTWVWQKHDWATLPTFIPGDVNDDGQVSAADVSLLRAYLAGFPVAICMYAADVNGDGQITAADLALVRAYLAGFPVTLGQP